MARRSAPREGSRERSIVPALVIVGILAGAAVVDLEYSRQSAAPRWHQSNAVWIAVYNGIEVNYTINNLAGFLRPGDGIALVMDNNSSNWGRDNYFAGLLHAAFPDLALRAYMSLDGGTSRAGGLSSTIGELSPEFTQASADWEIRGPVEFNPSYNTTVQYFENFSSIVRASGRLAIGYPSGRGVLGDYAGPVDHWDYGQFATHLDGMTIETQGICTNHTQWPMGLHKVWDEYNASNESIGTLSLQISLGVGGNGVNATEATYCASTWRQMAQGNVFLWWEVSDEAWLTQVLQGIGR